MGKKKTVNPDVPVLLERAKGRGIKLPKGKKAENEIADQLDDEEVEHDAILDGLEETYGLTVEGQKRKDNGVGEQLEGNSLAAYELACARGIKFPKSKDTIIEAVGEAAEGSGDHLEKAVKTLQDKFGLTGGAVKKGEKRKSAGDAAAEAEERANIAKATFKARAAERAAAMAESGGSSEGGAKGPPIEDPGDLEWPEDDVARKEVLKRVEALCSEAQIKMPSQVGERRMAIVSSITSLLDNGKVPGMALIKALTEQFGATWSAKTLDVMCEENRGLAEAFKEISKHEFASGDKFKGINYNKVADALRFWPSPMTEAPKPGQIPGVGKNSCDKIKEYLETGTMARLEEIRGN